MVYISYLFLSDSIFVFGKYCVMDLFCYFDCERFIDIIYGFDKVPIIPTLDPINIILILHYIAIGEQKREDG